MTDSVDGLFEEEIRDLYDAEKQLVKALPKMAKAASTEELRASFQEHLEVTKTQVGRLEEVFKSMEVKPRGKACEAMKGLVAEAQQAMEEAEKGEIMDLMLIGAAKRVEHYEMAAYQTVIKLAESVGNDTAAELLRETLSEEEETDEKLNALCEQVLEAVGSAQEDDEEDEDEEADEDEPAAEQGRPTRAGTKTRRAG